MRMKSTPRGTIRRSPALMPIFALGHIVPAIGAIHTSTGSYQYPMAVLGMIALTTGLVDGRLSTKNATAPPPKLTLRLPQHTIHIEIYLQQTVPEIGCGSSGCTL